jgi:hypothetical protein
MKEFIIRELEGDRSVVYGLDWAPLIGAKLDKQSLAHARRVKASHLVSAIEHSSSVGIVKLPADKKRSKGTLYSAGAVVALKHPTSAYLGVLEIEDDLVWVIATHNGSVIKGTDTLCSPAEAVGLAQSIRSRYPKIADLDDTDVQSYLNDRTQLKPVHYGFNAVPLPARLLAIGALALLVGNLTWDQASRFVRDYTRSHSTVPQVDAVREWTEALNNWAGQTLVDGPQGYAAVFRAALVIPTEVGGWKLLGSGKNPAVQCDAPSQRNWKCSVMFRRGIVATNESFLTWALHNRPDWHIQWIDLDTVLASWQAPGARHTITLASIPKQTTFSIDYISRLQKVKRAFTLIEVKPSVQVSISQPSMRDGGGNETAIELPAGMALPKVMGFTMKGSLRSLAAFPLNEHTRITRLKFDVDLNESHPDLRSSALYGEITGEYYVQ